jgi:hypothetical protein
MEEMRNTYKILVEKPKWKRPQERSRHIWEDHIRMALRETGWEVVGWIRLARTGTSGWLLGPSGFIKGGEFRAQLSNY